MKGRNFRKRSPSLECDSEEVESRLALEEVRFLQRQRERKSGIPAIPIPATTLVRKPTDKADGEGEKDDLVLQDTFAQETAVMVEDPNMLRYVEQELAKKKGKHIGSDTEAENAVKRAEDELYEIPDHLRVKRRNSQESSTQWTTGIAEVQLPMEYKLRNIEETEAAKKLLQEKRLVGRTKTDTAIPNPSTYTADKLRTEHPELYKGKDVKKNSLESRAVESGTEGAVQRQAATDEFMLERFRRRERHRGMRR